jgi:Zn-dependent protease/CBS domain-containing protein
MTRPVPPTPFPHHNRPAAPEARGPAGGSLRLLQLFGFDIRIHWSWPPIALLLIWSLATGYLASAFPDWSARDRWLTAGATSLLFFGSVLAHELAHSLLARRRGLTVRGVTLFIFGGVSALEDEPRRPWDEFWIALIGPLTSVAAAAGFGLVWLVSQAIEATPVTAVTGYLAAINLALGVFNLLPGFPLDGGRVLRAVLWGTRGSLLRATRIAAQAGRGVAALLAGLGVLSLLGVGGFGGLWFVLLGWFLWNAAGSSYQQVLLQRSLDGVRVSTLVEPDVVRVAPTMTLRELADDFLLRGRQRAFFVAPEAGGVLGLITLADVHQVPQEDWDAVSVYRAMTPLEQLVVVTPDTEATAALQLMAHHNLGHVPVVAGREVYGLLSRTGLLQALDVRATLASQTTKRRAA